MRSLGNKAPRWQAVVFFLYLAVQIAVPVYGLLLDTPARFGWQMYSNASVPQRLWLVSQQGTREISPASFIGNYRSDLDYERYALPQLCRAVPETKAIRYQMPLEDTVREYQC